MFYNLRIWALGYGPGIALTGEEYADLLGAIERTYLATGVEEKLDLLLENFLEYERELLDIALHHSLFTPLDDHRVFHDAQLINRRVVNLLTAARMYVDQVKHAVSAYFKSASASQPDVAALLSAEYDDNLEYRIAEALRNYAQHQDLPVHELSWPSAWEGMNEPQHRLRFWVTPSIMVDELATAGDFKASVLAELRATGKKSFPLTPILRRYVESLASVHSKLREVLASQATLDHQTVDTAMARARSELRESSVGLVISAGDDLEKPTEHHYVSERSWTRQKTLIAKNSHLTKLSRRYVSAEHPGDAV
ncbi:MAG TPA: hypothetical protein VGS57_13810 [Thermoanaerobaculia bacterium]|nr:hypothetical protein [Thermoanaerobaculia bacterium]